VLTACPGRFILVGHFRNSGFKQFLGAPFLSLFFAICLMSDTVTQEIMAATTPAHMAIAQPAAD
jgi:hypothetical protein